MEIAPVGLSSLDATSQGIKADKAEEGDPFAVLMASVIGGAVGRQQLPVVKQGVIVDGQSVENEELKPASLDGKGTELPVIAEGDKGQKSGAIDLGTISAGLQLPAVKSEGENQGFVTKDLKPVPKTPKSEVQNLQIENDLLIPKAKVISPKIEGGVQKTAESGQIKEVLSQKDGIEPSKSEVASHNFVLQAPKTVVQTPQSVFQASQTLQNPKPALQTPQSEPRSPQAVIQTSQPVTLNQQQIIQVQQSAPQVLQPVVMSMLQSEAGVGQDVVKVKGKGGLTVETGQAPALSKTVLTGDSSTVGQFAVLQKQEDQKTVNPVPAQVNAYLNGDKTGEGKTYTKSEAGVSEKRDKAAAGSTDTAAEKIVTAFNHSQVVSSASPNVEPKPLATPVEVHRAVPENVLKPEDLVAQITGKMKSDFKGNGGEVRMSLHPESLGHLKIEITVDSNVVKASIMAENAAVKSTIESNISMLKTSLEGQGLKVDQLSVGVDQRQGEGFARRDDLREWQRGTGERSPSYYENEEYPRESPGERWYRSHYQGSRFSMMA